MTPDPPIQAEPQRPARVAACPSCRSSDRPRLSSGTRPMLCTDPWHAADKNRGGGHIEPMPSPYRDPARVAIPEALAADVRAYSRPGYCTPTVERDAEALILDVRDPDRADQIGCVGVAVYGWPDAEWPDALIKPPDERAVHATAWALVGSVDGGPRPDVGDRVLVLGAPPGGGTAVGHVGVVSSVPDAPACGDWHGDDEGAVLVAFDPGIPSTLGGRTTATRVSRWAILPPAPDAEPRVIHEARIIDVGPHPHGIGTIESVAPAPPGPWRVGLSWGRTIVESGTGAPDEQGRRPDDRLVGVVETRADAERIVYAVNLSMREEAPTQDAYDAACRALEKHRARALELERERNRYRVALERIAPGAGAGDSGVLGGIAREALGGTP
jgi:hypothetical protein